MRGALSGAGGTTPHRVPPRSAAALPDDIRAAIGAHVRAEAPLEACGIVVGDAPYALGGRPLRFVALPNALASPVAFEAEAAAHVALAVALDEADEAVWAVVHSHPRTEARPSPTDLASAADPGVVQLIAGPIPDPVDATAVPLRAWIIRAGRAAEVELA